MYTHRDWTLYALPALVIGFIIFMLVAMPVGDILNAHHVRSYEKIRTVAAEMLATKEVPQVWPDGVSLDEYRTTQRIFCLRAWDGTWAKWVWTGGTTMPIDNGSGWGFWAGYGLAGLLCLLVGFGISCLIPERWLERVLCA